MFFVSFKICEIIKLQKIYLQIILRKNIFAKKKQTSKIGLCTVLFFQKTTSNINYNTELKNNYISDKYKKVYLQN